MIDERLVIFCLKKQHDFNNATDIKYYTRFTDKKPERGDCIDLITLEHEHTSYHYKGVVHSGYSDSYVMIVSHSSAVAGLRVDEIEELEKQLLSNGWSLVSK